MIRTISATFREGVFMPLVPIHDFAENTTLRIDIHVPGNGNIYEETHVSYTLEENLRVLRETAGALGSELSESEVRYLIESPDLAAGHAILDEDEL